MNVTELFETKDPEYWLSKIRESDWVAGRFLHDLLKNQSLQQYSGENARVLLLAEGERLISFCTLSDKDDILETDKKPWVGFVYTFPQYRGHRYMGRLLDHAAALAKSEGYGALYICTDQEGIYETYGFRFLEAARDRRGGETRVYVRCL